MVGQRIQLQSLPWPDLNDRQAITQMIAESSLFDSTYYLQQLPQPVPDPIEHYLEQGAWQGFNPHRLFHTHYYLNQAPVAVQNRINPLIHYLCEGASQGLDPNPLFDSWFYLGGSPTLASTGLTPLGHYCAIGSTEGRIAFPADRNPHLALSGSTSSSSSPQQAAIPPLSLSQARPIHRLQAAEIPVGDQIGDQIGIYCHSQSYPWIADLADLLATALRQIGQSVIRLTETSSQPAHLDLAWVVAAQDFCERSGADWFAHTIATRSTRSIVLNVAQPHTPEFAKALTSLQQADWVFDLNPQAATVLTQLGIPAHFLPLGYLADYAPLAANQPLPDLLALRSLPPALRDRVPERAAPLHQRPIDLCFIGSLSDRRAQFFAQQAACFSAFRCFFHLPSPTGSQLAADQILPTPAAIGLSQRSKILLNVHRTEYPDFEWQRLIWQGLWQNTLVVTEPCLRIPGLIPGQHYVECDLEDLPAQLAWLLTDPAGQTEAEHIRRAGHAALMQHFSIAPILQTYLDQMERSRPLLGGVA